MPWNGVITVSELRTAFVHQVLDQSVPVAQACREFGISRKTAYKWLRRFQQAPSRPLDDQSRRPKVSPRKTPQAIVERILHVRDRYHWGAAKIHAFLQQRGRTTPSARTINTILRRHGRFKPKQPQDPATQRFERRHANELWQMDFKGPLEIRRQRIHPLTILDDHSRYLLQLTPCDNMRFATVWHVLWDLFADVGLPGELLCDNQFNGSCRSGQAGLSWFDAQLLRLDIRPIHGRPYHPQTQGKVERLHGTLHREVLPFVCRTSLPAFARDLDHWRTAVYNSLRPHEALGMQVPGSRWRPSHRKRPPNMPPLEYDQGSVLRKIQASGWISYRSTRILIGKGLAGDYVRLEEDNNELRIFYANHAIRHLASNQLTKDTVL